MNQKLTPVKRANLPCNKVGLAIGSCSAKAYKSLKERGIELLEPLAEPGLERALSRHSDLVFLHLGDKNIVVSEHQATLAEKLGEYGFTEPHSRPLINSPYPQDVPLNLVLLGENVICNTKTAWPSLLEHLYSENFNIIDVKQGYTKCSVCVVNESAVITEDRTIALACNKAGIDALLISKGTIKLKGHEYGFIGGCSGLVAGDCLAFHGKLEEHKDSQVIYDFLDSHKIQALSLSDESLTDIGGILPILEYEP
ncbi:MAG: hypothetical protein GX345_04250 [Clostridiales bacterium]|nr:hypothetical protein [Clostridiales bacterium]